ncbi:MAG: leucine-rich repeat domain-containing protein, partial [Treponema sp.]|nr:leucine-rich repeat domain-containing protein [Treponema sp.]
MDFTTITSFKTDANITVGAAQTAAGKGLVSLEVNVDCAEIDHARVWYRPTGADSPRFLPATKSGSTYTFNIGYLHDGDYVDAVQSGAYTMTFDFLPEDNSLILYSFKETVNVFDGMTTNKWVKNGSEPWLTPSGTGIACKITSAMVDGFKLTEIYVDTSRQTTNPNAEDGSYTTASGTFLNPKRSFTDALAMLQDASKNYTIFIKGNIGPQTIPDTLKNSGSGGGNTYAKSLTLCGAGDPEDGVPTDIIDAAGAAGTSALTIATTVPVTIKNLKITGGRGTIKEVSTMGGWLTISNACGGGIYLSAAGGSLTLGRGAYVSENTANASAGASSSKYGYGGGVFISAPGELNLLDGSVVSNNGAEINGNGGGIAIYDIDATGASCKLNIYDGALIEKNQATLNGGGIYLGNLPVDVAMSGGRISGNVSGISGGAIYGSSGTFTMTGGVIGDDSPSIIQAANYDNYTDATRLSDNANKAGGNGGAFCFANTSGGSDKFNINLYGGTIAYNCAQNDGGAFEFEGGNLTVQGAEIKWNGASGETSGGGGGAIYLGSRTKLHLGDCTITGNECYGTSVGGAICIPRFPDFADSPKTYLKGAVSIPSDGPQKNDIALTSDDDSLAYPSLYIDGKLTGSEPVATITPSLYSSDRQVLQLADGVTDTSVPEEAGKFEVTPQVDGGVTKNWIVASTGMLAKVVRVTASEAAAAIPSLENGDILQITGEITGTRSSGLAGGILTALQASPASVKITLDLSKCTNTTMANNCFEYCSCIDNVILPPNLTAVPNSLFSECHLTSVTFPSALESIGSAAFNKCDFTSITIPNTVKTVGNQAFANNASLTTVSMSNSVTSLGEGCFANCSELTSVTLSNKITELPAEVFLNCSRFRMSSVPGNVTTLGDRAFCGTACTNFEVNTKVTSLGAELFKNTSITRVTLLGNFTWYCNGEEVMYTNFAAT